jgi:hypothetical protein
MEENECWDQDAGFDVTDSIEFLNQFYLINIRE